MKHWYTRHHAEDGIYWKKHSSEDHCHAHAEKMFAPSIRKSFDNVGVVYTDTAYGRRMWVCHMTDQEYRGAVIEDEANYSPHRVSEE